MFLFFAFFLVLFCFKVGKVTPAGGRLVTFQSLERCEESSLSHAPQSSVEWGGGAASLYLGQGRIGRS